MDGENLELAAFWFTEIRHLPKVEPVIVRESVPAVDVISQMKRSQVGCALVVDEADQLIGIFTERDVMRKYVATTIPRDTSINKLMTRNPMTLSSEDKVSDAAKVIGEIHFRHLPITDDSGMILGLLSVRCLMDYLAENLPEAVLNLPPDGAIVSQEMEGG